MKLLFLCSSLEPGLDGVGDYTQALAAECARRGHTTLLLALADPHLPPGKIQKNDGQLRLSSSLPFSLRQQLAEEKARDFAPDLCSWQLVAYGFNPKGILPSDLATMASQSPFKGSHVMMHELWIGVSEGASLKDRLIGWVQRRAMRRFLQALAPARIHTSNEAYCTLLASLGLKASRLPLFGNIPVCPAPSLPGSNEQVRNLDVLLFGTLHPQWNPSPFASWLQAQQSRLGRQANIIAAGRTGAHAPAILEKLREAGIRVTELGEQTPEQISALMQRCHLGVAAHPWALLGKSGVVAAMIDHGLPILVPRDDWHLRGLKIAPSQQMADPLLLRLSEANNHHTDVWLAKRRQPTPSLPLITAQFLDEIPGSSEVRK